MRKDEFPIVEKYSNDRIIEELKKIKEEIEDIEEPNYGFESFFYCQEEAQQIIEKHIAELKGENK